MQFERLAELALEVLIGGEKTRVRTGERPRLTLCAGALLVASCVFAPLRSAQDAAASP